MTPQPYCYMDYKCLQFEPSHLKTDSPLCFPSRDPETKIKLECANGGAKGIQDRKTWLFRKTFVILNSTETAGPSALWFKRGGEGSHFSRKVLSPFTRAKSRKIRQRLELNPLFQLWICSVYSAQTKHANSPPVSSLSLKSIRN